MRTRVSFFTVLISTILIFSLLNSVTQSPSHASSLKLINAHRQVSASTSLINNINLPTPSWWSGNCDVNNNPGSTPLGSSYRGMITCGPFPPPDHTVYFPKGDIVQVNEWECTELAMRYLYLAYGQHPYVASGGQVVSNYPGTLLHQFNNLAGSGNAPQVGDIISSNTSNSDGHVVVVQAEDPTVPTSGTGNITVIDENGIAGSGGIETYHDNNWFVDSGVTSWLHPNTLVNSPNVTSYDNRLTSVATIAADNVWAVGYSQLSSGNYQTLIEHWDGSQWTIKTSPNLSGNNYLYGVAVLSSNNIWAVGSYGGGTLLLHYNGKTWASSTQGPGILYAITRVSPTEAWAVGYSSSGTDFELHLVGNTWTPFIGTNQGAQLLGISAVSTSNVWAVGMGGFGKTITLQWNGSSWNLVPSPNPGQNFNQLWGVTAISANDIWAVGRSDSSPNDAAFFTHWNGSQWGTPIILSVGTSSILTSVTAFSSKNVWTVGQYWTTAGSHPLIERWNGKIWSQISSPDGGANNYLNSITANRANGNIWAVGYAGTISYPQTLTEFYN